MVVRLVFELQQPSLGFAVYVYIHIYAAGIVLFALFEVVEHSGFAEIAGADSGEVH